jgi:DNA-binding protein H-NS
METSLTAKDIENMSVHELKYLIKTAQERIEELEALEQLQTMEKIQDLARQAGLEVQIKPAARRSRKRAGGSVAVKYRNPSNAEETWSGRGRKPRWVEEALAAGKTLGDLAVKGSA